MLAYCNADCYQTEVGISHSDVVSKPEHRFIAAQVL